LNIVSRLRLWRDRAPEALAAGINLPASVPALDELERRRIPMTTVSSLLGTADYHEAWREGFLTVWGMVESARAAEEPDRPNEAHIYAYPLFITACQILILWRALDACRRAHRIDSVCVEAEAGLDPGDSVPFSSGLFSGYHHAVAARWARANGLPVTELAAGPEYGDPPRNHFRASLPLAVRKGLERVHVRLVAPFVNSVKNVAYLALGGRDWVCHWPVGSAGLTGLAPWNVLDVSRFSCIVWKWESWTGGSAPALAPESRPQPGEGPTSTVLEILRGRWSRGLRKSAGPGYRLFRTASRALRALKARGFRFAFVTVEPFREDGGIGYLAEAFRKAGCPVGGIQHGGNTRLARKGAIPTFLADFLGGTFFQWGDAAADESAEYGVRERVSFVRTGSPSIRALLDGRRGPPRSGVPGSLLYVPTYFSVYTTIGNVTPWDDYFPLVKRVLEILNRCEARVTVKLLNTPEAGVLDVSAYPRLAFRTHGTLKDYVWKSDALIVDSLAGAAAYEVLATDRPAVVYAGAEHQSWDAAFLDKLKKRAVCYFDGASYVRGLGEMAADPGRYFASAPDPARNELTAAYTPPAEKAVFWNKVRQELFPRSDEGRYAS
jgi:hypothetical protein